MTNEEVAKNCLDKLQRSRGAFHRNDLEELLRLFSLALDAKDATDVDYWDISLRDQVVDRIARKALAALREV